MEKKLSKLCAFVSIFSMSLIGGFAKNHTIEEKNGRFSVQIKKVDVEAGKIDFTVKCDAVSRCWINVESLKDPCYSFTENGVESASFPGWEHVAQKEQTFILLYGDIASKTPGESKVFSAVLSGLKDRIGKDWKGGFIAAEFLITGFEWEGNRAFAETIKVRIEVLPGGDVEVSGVVKGR
jgi:hypothetical protein